MENRAAFFLPPEGIDTPRGAMPVTLVTYPPLISCISELAEKYIQDGPAEEFYSPLRPKRLEAVVTPSAAISAKSAGSLIPGIEEQYISLCPPLKDADEELCYTVKLLKSQAEQNIKEATSLWQARLLVERRINSLMSPFVPTEKLLKRGAGIVSREIPKKGGVGRRSVRYIDAVTPDGYQRLYDTVTAMAGRLYDVEDTASLGGPMLEYIANAAVSRGYDCYVCPAPMEDRLLHVIIPELSLAFVTSDHRAQLKAATHRRVRLDGYLASASREDKASCRALTRLCRQLESEVCRCLSKAAAMEDKIDELMLPHIDMKAFKKQLNCYK